MSLLNKVKRTLKSNKRHPATSTDPGVSISSSAPTFPAADRPSRTTPGPVPEVPLGIPEQCPTIPAERDGLFRLDGGESAVSEGEQYPVDIVAVHGLNGNCFTTWTHPSTRQLWLRDFLPNALPGCRVYTYGYPSKVFSASVLGVRGFAGRLLFDLQELREDAGQNTRPIILVCHSLGGIVCKQALVIAHEDNLNPGNQWFLQCLAGIVFLGTPHSGSSHASLGSVVIGVVKDVFRDIAPVRADLLRHLETQSKELQHLSDAVIQRLAGLKIYCFFETKPEIPGFGIIVPEFSAKLVIPECRNQALHTTHRNICRFATSHDKEYQAILRAIRDIAVVTPRVPGRTSTHSSRRSWSDSEKSCMSLISQYDPSEYRQKRILDPAKGTCQWILTHPLFVSWHSRAEAALLWLTGRAGCGKTVLSLFVARWLEDSAKPQTSANVCVYFCNNTITTQRTANSIVSGIILQLADRCRSLVKHPRKAFQVKQHNLVNDFQRLWEVFKDMVGDPKCGPTIIVIDALDECDEISRGLLLEAINDFLNTPDHPGVKFIITSRPLHDVEERIEGATEQRISINECQGARDGDLSIYIQQRLSKVFKRRPFPEETRKGFQDSLYQRSEQTFLWVSMVLDNLEQTSFLSPNDLEAFLHGFPPGLEKTYEHFVSAIPDTKLETASTLLKLILGSSQLLHLDEISVACAIRSEHHTLKQVQADSQPSKTGMETALSSALGQLVKVSDSTVSLAHQSVKEFILQQAVLNDRLPRAIRTITQEDCTLAIATACINLLTLDDFHEGLFRQAGSSARQSFDSSIRYQGSSATCSVRSSIDQPSLTPHDGAFDLANLFKDSTTRDEDTCQDLAAQYPFYRYAALHWAEHFARCEPFSPPTLTHAVKTLLDTADPKCSNWLRFYAAETKQTFLTDLNSLPLAAFFNHQNAVKSYLDNSELITQNDIDNALFWTAYRGHDHIVHELLIAGGEPNIQEPSSGQTPLVAASKNGHLSSAKVLLANGRTDINTKARHDRTALSHACAAGYSELVETLLNREDCNVNEVDRNGRTALMWAVEGGDIRSVELLVKHVHRIDINHSDKTGRTAVSLAAGDASSSNSTKILERLMALKRQGIDLNLKDNQGRSPLSWAAGNGCTGAVKRLLHSNRVDSATVDHTGRNVISWACGTGHAETLEYLLGKKCPGVNDRDESGWSPLAWAIQNPSPATTVVLLDHGADVEGRDHGGRTALSWAAEYGHILVVKALLMRDADPNSVSESGETPMVFAKRYAREDVMKELRWYMRQA